MYELITVAEVAEGTAVNYEYAPGREASPVIRRKVRNADGTYTLHLGSYGAISGYRPDDMLLVV